MWAGAGVGGLRTPARCLDSNRAIAPVELRSSTRYGEHSAENRQAREVSLCEAYQLGAEPVACGVRILFDEACSDQRPEQAMDGRQRQT